MPAKAGDAAKEPDGPAPAGGRVARFLRRHYRSLLALVAASYAVFRYARNLAFAWLQFNDLPFVSGAADFLIARPLLAVTAGVAVFAAVFGAVRYALR